MNNLTTLQNTNEALLNIEKRFYNIPFENSNFQNNAFVVAAQITPERAYRAIGLRIHSKLRALQENYFNERKSEIRIGELQELIESSATSKWDKMRHELEIEQILTSRPYTEKLKNDAMQEIACLYAHLEKLPEYTREEFEAGEMQHFIETSKRQTNGITGGEESLVNMIKDIPALEAYKEAVIQITDNSQLDLLRLNMQNQLVTKEQVNA
jgi:cell fate (sporulation/competence/biofilm development) regulator YmcA (YheA/YmcA/DUF963 family)